MGGSQSRTRVPPTTPSSKPPRKSHTPRTTTTPRVGSSSLSPEAIKVLVDKLNAEPTPGAGSSGNAKANQALINSVNALRPETMIARLNAETHQAMLARLKAEAIQAMIARLNAEADQAMIARLNAETHQAMIARLKAEANQAMIARLNAETHQAMIARLKAEANQAMIARLNAEADQAMIARLNAETHQAMIARLKAEANQAMSLIFSSTAANQATALQSSSTAATQATALQSSRVAASQATALQSSRVTTSQATPLQSQSSTSQLQVKLKPASPASQKVKHAANNYVIPAAECKARSDPRVIKACQDTGLSHQGLRVCPQYNGYNGCVTDRCRRLHICLFWATKTCTKASCKCDHNLDSEHNTRLIRACTPPGQNDRKRDITAILDNTLGSSRQEEGQICLFSVLKKCTKEPCPRVHARKSYRWEVKEGSGWIQFSYNQSDYLELLFTHPSEERVILIPLETRLANNRNLQKLKSLLSKDTSWTVDFEAFELQGSTSVRAIRRLTTASDLTSQVPVATRWVWHWQDDDGCWEVYGEGSNTHNHDYHTRHHYHVALSDHLENTLRVHNKRFVAIECGKFSYTIDGQAMIQTSTTTGTRRRVRRRPASSLITRKGVKFDEVFFTLPSTKKFLKLPLAPLSSEFLFMEGLLNQSLSGLQISSVHRVQNEYLWKKYQNKKRLLVSLYGGDEAATNEQYLFHCTGHDAVDHICEDNLDWKLWGTNAGHLYGQGTYFSNMAQVAHWYGKVDKAGRKVMLVVLVLVGCMTKGHKDMTLPPENKSAGRAYDTTCDSTSNASIFVKYDRDEYYPAYVVRYNCSGSD